MSHQVLKLSNLAEYRKYITDNACVVKFTASWCGPCKRIAPTFNEAANKYHDKIKFIEVSLDDEDEKISTEEKVQAVPNFIFYDHSTKLTDLTVVGCNIPLLNKNIDILVQRLSANNIIDNIIEEIKEAVKETNQEITDEIKDVIENIKEEILNENLN